MTSYVVTFELKHGDEYSEEYRKLKNELTRLCGFRARPFNWLVDLKIGQNAAHLQSHLKPYLQPGDTLSVVELTRSHKLALPTNAPMAGWLARNPPLR